MNSYSGKSQRIGIFGGSFDPLHLGHLVVAQDAIERLELAELIFMPAAIPPHKQHIKQVSAEHRLNMVRLCVESDMRFSVCDYEVVRGGVSYTLDTVRAVKDDFPDAQLMLIIGSDSLVELHTWKSVDKILEVCDIATLIRPGIHNFEEIQRQLVFSEELKSRLLQYVIEAHPVDISSTEIRMRIAEGLSIRYLVPQEVEMYISEHGLYQA